MWIKIWVGSPDKNSIILKIDQTWFRYDHQDWFRVTNALRDSAYQIIIWLGEHDIKLSDYQKTWGYIVLAHELSETLKVENLEFMSMKERVIQQMESQIFEATEVLRVFKQKD